MTIIHCQSCNLIFKTEISVVFGKSKCHTHKGEQIVGNLHASYARQCGRECQVVFFQVWGVERPVRNGEMFAVSVNLCPHGIEILIGKLEHENHEIYLSQGEASCCPASMQLGSFSSNLADDFPGHVPQSQRTKDRTRKKGPRGWPCLDVEEACGVVDSIGFFISETAESTPLLCNFEEPVWIMIMVIMTMISDHQWQSSSLASQAEQTQSPPYGGFLKWGYPPTSSILVGFSTINNSFLGIPIDENPHIIVFPINWLGGPSLHQEACGCVHGKWWVKTLASVLGYTGRCLLVFLMFPPPLHKC